MSEPIDKLWQAHNELAVQVNDLSKQQEMDRAMFERQLASIEHRQTDILTQVSSSYKQMETSFKEQNENLSREIKALHKRLDSHERLKERSAGHDEGARAERSKLIKLFSLILTGVVATFGWLLTK